MAFFDKMKEFLDKSVEASKNAFDKAGVAVQDFGDKSVTKIEIKKLELKADKLYSQVGKMVSEGIIADAKYSIPADNEEFNNLISEIKAVKAEIKEKQDSLAEEEAANNAETSEKKTSSKKTEKK